ncbi:MAG: methyltransferase domain-containing protein, partial [Halobacteriales archaeon]|nr:methyltransferase domain-containing protein [Halobacteriales archaeon]
FDAVTCRIAAHHFPDPEAFVEEVARVLATDGVFALEDNIAPDEPALDAFLNRIERLRDPTHVRSYTEPEWLNWLREAGFRIDETVVMTKEIPYEPWVDQQAVPDEVRTDLERAFLEAPEAAHELFEITVDERGALESFTNLKLLVRAIRS